MESLDNFNKTNIKCLAGYILKYFGPMSHLKLQKLLFYCQAYHLAKFDEPLFEEDFQAWVHGPVCRDIYDILKAKSVLYSDVKYNEYDFDSSNKLSESISSVQFEIVNDVLNSLNSWTGSELEAATHNEQPWINARKGYSQNQNCEVIISKKDMKEFYKTEMNGWSD